MPMFDLKDAAGVLMELQRLPQDLPAATTSASSPSTPRAASRASRMSFIVNRPANEPGFALARQETRGRSMRYTMRSYATDRPEGERGNGKA